MLIAEQIAEAAEELRARESATLDAMAEAFLPGALAGDPRSAEVLLKIRSAYRRAVPVPAIGQGAVTLSV